ncbi:hypothetical protein M409DRAFT_23383 [Zasmidium cellare ATCC 36951]|uniref:Extracellular membrane protein CFEM domain-containing protein n=1 Tax=Zasmidium cellare ATCC 36951 TaxID=1080233 RepID=A0A6A6CG84_ZASCE|nr:uncharacterized protein M409DRAFT_23383 [Zasmidium cellare ATCC 36951]KAF2166194.1 hypothetical protein M409DRAFT_23383 [Zasmidium cellare ATCC 36951]
MKFILLALASAVTAAVTGGDDCQTTYDHCRSSGGSEVSCQCDLATCSGEDSARIRDYCASATSGAATSPPSASSYTTPPQPYGPTGVTSPTNIVTGTPGSQPSGQPPVNAPEGSLDLGATCSDDKQCRPGVQCWASNAGLIRRCGNFNAACKSNAQCAYNTCNNGLCNGFISPSANASMTAEPTGTGFLPNGTSAPTSSIVPYEGAAPMSSIMSGFAAMFFGVIAWVL